MVAAGTALCVPGQPRHEAAAQAARAATSRSRTAWPRSLAQLERRAAGVPRRRSPTFLDGLVSHYVLDDGKLVVAHAGMKEEMQGRGSGKVRDFALYGETTGETDEFGLPVRYNWAAEYRGTAMVVYGHTPVPEPEWLNRTINIDTGCVFGGKLTALRYPERELVSVPAARTYCEPARPFLPPSAGAGAHGAAGARRPARHRRRARQADRLDPAARQRHDPRGERHRGAGGDEPVRRRPEVADLPAADDVAVRDERASRACWSIPPRRSPTTAARASPRVVCEEKHMGSRAVVVVCRDEAAARERFGVVDGERRHRATPAPGRRFFDDAGAGDGSSSTACAPALDRGRTSGTSSRPTGSASTAS